VSSLDRVGEGDACIALANSLPDPFGVWLRREQSRQRHEYALPPQGDRKGLLG